MRNYEFKISIPRDDSLFATRSERVTIEADNFDEACRKLREGREILTVDACTVRPVAEESHA